MAKCKKCGCCAECGAAPAVSPPVIYVYPTYPNYTQPYYTQPYPRWQPTNMTQGYSSTSGTYNVSTSGSN